MKYQIAKLYRRDRFIGYGIACGGMLLSDQVSTTINTEAAGIPTITAIFNMTDYHVENQVRIDVDEPRMVNELQIVIHPDGPISESQLTELHAVLTDFLKSHSL